MTSHNEHTGDKIQTKVTTKEYLDNFDKVFSKKDRDEYDKTMADLLQVDIPTEKEKTNG